MNKILIRQCRAGDLPAVRDLLGQLSEMAHGESNLDLCRMADMMHQMDAAPDFYLNLVAETGGRVSGFISLIFYQTFFHRAGTCLINELVVDRVARGSGIGRALIDRAVAEARSRGMDEIEVGTEQDNQAAQAFYHKCGFDEAYVLLGMEFDA